MILDFIEFRDRTHGLGFYDTFQDVMDLAELSEDGTTIKVNRGHLVRAGIWRDGVFVDIRSRARCGTWLKKILGWLRIKPSVGCNCNQYAKEMDQRGPAWCRDNNREIRKRLREAAKNSGIPYFMPVAWVLIHLAIRCAEYESWRFRCQHGDTGQKIGEL
jgi:hypothetical protein